MFAADTRSLLRRAQRVTRVGALLALVCLGGSLHAQWRLWDADFDEERKPWKEIEAKIPPYPATASLVAFDAGGASPHRFFVDARSLSIGDDGVVRYTLVIKTAGGATNVTFEGIRCDTRQQKVYALGRADGSWARARNPEWRRIEYHDVNRHHITLYADYFCVDGEPMRSVKEALQLLRYGPSPASLPQPE
ncbi:MAG: CNP1-like family protein [Betaproteobacteria bacterium]|nr:CNP1-like family protein [Betaproteobacteria bacterium]